MKKCLLHLRRRRFFRSKAVLESAGIKPLFGSAKSGVKTARRAKNTERARPSMAPGDYAGLQANRPRRLHSGTRSFFIAFFAGPEFLLLHLYTALLLPALFLAFARKNPLRIFALRGNRFVGAPSARNRRKERLDLPLPVQFGAPANPAQGDMRMVLVAPRGPGESRARRHADGFGGTFCHQKVPA